MHVSTQEAIKEGRHVTLVGLWANIALAMAKIGAGIAGRSSAMLADGVHSASDLVTDAIVLAVIKVSHRHPDSGHSYGHGKIETFASFVISLLLAAVAIGFFIEGIEKVIDSLRGTILPRPGMVALIIGVVSIIVKEWLFRYTRRVARRISSSALEANAWHHRSDSFSSIATVLGVAGAIFLGAPWRILDPVAAIAVSVIILAMAYKMARDAVGELVEASLPQDMTEPMKKLIEETPGVVAIHNFKSRRNGSRIIIDVHAEMNPDISLIDAHTIATRIEHRLRSHYGHISANIHMEPAEK